MNTVPPGGTLPGQRIAYDPIAGRRRFSLPDGKRVAVWVIVNIEEWNPMVFDPTLLRMLVELVGAERVMLGSDYPFDMGDDDPVGVLAAAGLTPAQTAQIASATATGFFCLDA